MNKTLLTVLLSILPVLLLTSCYDAKEIDEQTYVLTMGIDKGVSNKWRLTLQIPSMKDESGGGKGGEQGDSGKGQGKQSGYTTVSIDSSSFFEGINILESSIPRFLNFEHLKYIVVSEEMARSGQSGEYMAPIRRFRHIRDSAHFIVSRGSAEKFVNELQPFIGTRISKSQELMMIVPSNTGFFPHVTLKDLYDGLKSSYRQPIAILGGVNDLKNYKERGKEWGSEFKPGGEYLAGQLPKKSENSIELFGTAVFNGDRMVGELDGNETRVMLMGRGEFQRGFFDIPDPKQPELVVPLDVRQKESQRKVSTKIENGKPIIHLKLELEGNILSIQSMINYESPELKPILEKAFERFIKTELDELIIKTKALKADILQFGRTIVWHFNTIQDWEKYDWIAQYENAEVTTEVSFTIKGTGAMLGNSPVFSSEGRK
jgi:Ger(x)C family germination protein